MRAATQHGMSQDGGDRQKMNKPAHGNSGLLREG
jgi:hypothetical protein